MTSTACGPLSGTAEVPGDKSISHRSLILGAMSVGETTIEGLLEGQDVLDTARAMRAFGAEVTDHGGGSWSVNKSFFELSRAGAAGRTVLREAGAALLNQAITDCHVENGRVSCGERSIGFAEIVSR